MDGRDAANRPVVLRYVDRAVVGEAWHTVSSQVGEESLVGERAGHDAARLGEKLLRVDGLGESRDGARRRRGRVLDALHHSVEHRAQPADLVGASNVHAPRDLTVRDRLGGVRELGERADQATRRDPREKCSRGSEQKRERAEDSERRSLFREDAAERLLDGNGERGAADRRARAQHRANIRTLDEAETVEQLAMSERRGNRLAGELHPIRAGGVVDVDASVAADELASACD